MVQKDHIQNQLDFQSTLSQTLVPIASYTIYVI